MLAITQGSTAFRAISDASELLPNEVAFSGEFLWEDAFTPGMVWDAGIGNVRAKNTAESLGAVKAQRITAINTECRTRLLARFGDPAEQVSRSIGVYGTAEQAALSTRIAATIDASNTASDAVTAATTIAEVEAVTVTWPAI